MVKLKSKFVAIMMLVFIMFSSFSNIIYAKTVGMEAHLENKGDCGRHLQFWDSKQNAWSYVICYYVAYNENGKEYPAYCLNKDAHGVGDAPNYSVDLTKTLDDDRVWRTIVNSYPYKSPQEMGVDNIQDAFVATKQAVYCVIYGYDPATRYRGGDERGNKITNAIIDLTNIGRNGTQTQQNSKISVAKVGGFKEDGEYYSQEYSVNSGVDIGSFTVSATSGMPQGGDIIKNGNSGFKIRVPKSAMSNDININFSIQAKAKTYPIFYGKTRISGTQDYAITSEAYADEGTSGNLSVATNTAGIVINKTNNLGDPVEGAEFSLIKDGKEIQTRKTDSNGRITFDKLYQGKYEIKEKNAPYGYLIVDAKYNVDIKVNSSESKTIVNEEPTGTISIIKQDSETGSKPQGDATLKGAIYEVIANEDIYNVAKTKKFYSKGEVVATRKMDEKGQTQDVQDLPLGKYIIKEKTPSEGYLKDETVYDANLQYKDQYTKVITKKITSKEKVMKMGVHIFKSGIKVNTGEVPGLENVEYTIKLASDVNRAYSQGFTYSEIWNGIDENGNNVKVDYTRAHNAQTVAPSYAVITTDKDGNAYTQKNLPYGKYTVKETKTPEDFEIAKDFTFSITTDESLINNVAQKSKHIILNNEQLESYIKLVKKDLKSGKNVTLNSTTFEIRAVDDIIDRATKKVLYRRGELISQKVGEKIYTSFTTNADNVVVPNDSYYTNDNEKSKVITPLKLPVGKYVITELHVPEGFLQLEEPVRFEIRNIKTYDKNSNGDYIKEITLKNEQPTGTLYLNKNIVKRDDADKTFVDTSDLSGIKFKLSAKEDVIDKADGSIIYNKNQEIGTYNLSKDGKLVINNLPMGTYEIQEIQTLDGLVLNEEKYEVKFEQKDLITKIYEQKLDISNKTTLVEISKRGISKVEELEGAKLQVLDENRKVIDEWISTSKPHKIEGLIVGKEYILREVTSPNGYEMAEEITFKVKNTDKTQKVIMLDRLHETPKEENEFKVSGKEINVIYEKEKEEEAEITPIIQTGNEINYTIRFIMGIITIIGIIICIINLSKKGKE